MRPTAWPPPSSRTTTLPSKKRASVTVSVGTAERSNGTRGASIADGWNCGQEMSGSSVARPRCGDDNLRNCSTLRIIVTPLASFKSRSIALPIGVLIVAMFCFQIGAALAKQLFPVVGAAGAAALRLGLASLMLVLFWRPWRMRPTVREARTIAVYGLAMGLMNLFFYLSLNLIPLGLTVALEFMGPLAVAIAASRRPVDFLWIALAVLGLMAILPIRATATPLDPLGIAYAVAAAVCWGMYIVFGQKTGNTHSGQTTALGTVAGAVFLVPIGAVHAGWALLSPAVLPLGCALALLSSALPYSMEMYAMTRVPARTFGVLMSLDPALAALSGLCFLGESLSVIQWAAIAGIMLASAGSAATSRFGPRASTD
jgi:inner membrane transporter RhtA